MAQEVKIQDKIQEIYLNGFGQLIGEKISETEVDSSRIIEVYIATAYLDFTGSFTYDKILEIENYGDHIKITEYYKSFLGEITVQKVLHNIKPSSFLKMLFPELGFK